jgi:hypothetical protein
LWVMGVKMVAFPVEGNKKGKPSFELEEKKQHG